MGKQEFQSAIDKQNKPNGKFFSPVKKMSGGELPFFQGKSEQLIPSIDCGPTYRREDANFDETKISDGIMTKSDTRYGKFIVVKNLYMDTFKIIFEKSAAANGADIRLNVTNGTTTRDFVQTSDKIELKLNIPNTGISWEFLVVDFCYALRIGFGLSS